MKKLIVISIFSVFLMLQQEVSAQCSMCKRVAESGLENGEKKGRGLNTGILYLMSVPYLMGGVAGYIWWKNNKKEKAS
ncbi:MAG: hypothetical protein IPN36_18245 [Bacteroidetes bacterium]|nr:hypothetical protein [Bacteroidota bacterium]